jgi:GntR family transcriptional regulator/MocR family aminotransferase
LKQPVKTPAKAIVPYISLDPASAEPMQRQLYDALRRIILHGRLTPGVRLPASRTLARALGISRNTVLFAYEELAADGLLAGRIGAGTQVATAAISARVADPDGHAVQLDGFRLY